MVVLQQSEANPRVPQGHVDNEPASIAMRLVTRGDDLLKAGDHQKALAAYRHARDILDGLTAGHGDNTQRALDLSLVHRKIGDALRAQGNLWQAREAYLSSLAIAQRLASSYPATAEVERNLAEVFKALTSVSDRVVGLAPPTGAGPHAGEPQISMDALRKIGPLLDELRRQVETEARDRAKFSEPAGDLIENIPRKMRVGALEKVEVRIARRDVEGLTEGLIGRGHLQRHEVRVADAMTVRLRAPDGGFLIDPLSAETCWTYRAKSLELQEHDFASWRWSVTPQRRGQARLHLIISAQTFDANGITAEATLPDQVIKVHVRVNYGRTVRKVAGWGLLMVTGGALSAWGRELYPAALDALARFWPQ